jgi:hypothetical protein
VPAGAFTFHLVITATVSGGAEIGIAAPDSLLLRTIAVGAVVAPVAAQGSPICCGQVRTAEADGAPTSPHAAATATATIPADLLIRPP